MAIERNEVGSNIFELIEFTLERRLSDGTTKLGRYGINVAKVREVVRMTDINPLSSSIKGVAGVFQLRGIPIPAINLSVVLGDKEAPITNDQQIIVAEFSMKRAGFIVKSTSRIRRITWDKVLPPAADKFTCINGMTLIENDEFLFILDLEKIISTLEVEIDGRSKPSFGMNTTDHESDTFGEGRTPSKNTGGNAVNGCRILVVDDSPFILNNIRVFLEREGYAVTTAPNGLRAKNILKQLSDDPSSKKFDVIITDIEMPKMDGLTLTRWIKESKNLQHTPVILHTSLSGKANEEAAATVGANGYVIKNELDQLRAMIQSILKQHVGT